MKDTLIDGIRKECLRIVADTLRDSQVSDAVRKHCIDETAELIDSLIRSVAVYTKDLGRRESRAVAQHTFTRVFPLVCASVVPALMVSQGVQEAAAKLAADILEAHRRNSGNDDEGKN